MWNRKQSVGLSLASCAAAFAAVIALIVFGPVLFDWYYLSFRQLTDAATLHTLRTTLFLCVYSGSVLGLIALTSLMRILHNIARDRVFILQNVTLLRIIAWCCFSVGVICFAGCFFYLPLVFVAGAACFAAIILRVVKNVMQSAVELREEHDLTI